MDASCPMVKEIHRIARCMEAKGYRVVIIGDTHHDEVRGIVGQLKHRALVIDSRRQLPLNKMRHLKKCCIVVQSTQNLDKVLATVGAIKARLNDVKFFNTICLPTRTKQAEIKNMPGKNDVMIVIGSKTSANTRRLFEISKSQNPETHWINSKTEIKKEWFRKAKSVGITAGASTPDATTQGVVRYIRKNFS
jgi:4-hydroxy-3-methylbut-2-enyl diphosphate reductase